MKAALTYAAMNLKKLAMLLKNRCGTFKSSLLYLHDRYKKDKDRKVVLAIIASANFVAVCNNYLVAYFYNMINP